MKIVDVEPIILQVPLDVPVVTSFGSMTSRTTVLVRIEADTGVYGIGEIWNNFPSWGLYEKLATLKYGMIPLLIGEDPTQISNIHDKLLRAHTVVGLQWGALGPIYHSVSGIDMALWDLLGKYRGEPVAKLLGGPVQPSVEVYASGLGPGPFEDFVEQHLAMGVNAFKLKVGKDHQLDLANLQRLRKLVPETARVMIDANQAWDRRTAIRVLQQYRAYGLTWIEEPLRCDDPEGLAIVRHQTGIPTAAGENLYGVRQVRQALEKHGLDVIQPDLSKQGGITASRSIVEMAASWEVPYAPHFLGAAVCLAASIHFAAALPGNTILELDANPNPLRERLFTRPVKVVDGRIAVPEEPGLGFELDREFVQFHQVPLRDISL
ncbi:mandelate racemase/muconate lactonizing enzyme family protein [Alicyclobacillus acidiphilus]|uniref:mandelate racemase/muconate lactonizing enzyme family protein n=1 Tax=Alicyclobacillus acidiphilus TaxID=182455 RepID=UPI00082A9E58|nr:mandelate racemase/muconate lactonizing enzyme family protein [Alicyclobacillus acidiphilus]